MRLLAVGLLYPPHQLGGYELICEGVMRRAEARGHDVRILASDYRTPLVREPDELSVHRSLRSYYDESAQRAAALGPGQCLVLERHNRRVLERHIHDFRPDVVNWWAMGMSLSLIERVRRKGLPAVLVVQDDWLSYGPEADRWTRMGTRFGSLTRPLELLSGIPLHYELEHAGRYLFNSKRTLEAAAGAGIRPRDSAVITPGVHARFLESAPAKSWSWRLLCVGRVDPSKGTDLAVAALEHLPKQATLTIAGAGDREVLDRLRHQAEELGVDGRVAFLGPVSAQELPGIYAGADAVLFPIRWQEPWGLVPLEAMGVGSPVVAVPRGGAATYLRDGENSLCIPAEDPLALAAALQRLAGDPDLRARLRAEGIQTAVEHSAARYEDLIVDELERAAGGPA